MNSAIQPGAFTHYRAAPGVALCLVAFPGDILVTNRADVTCPSCKAGLA